jgi:hypothetical protein
MWMKVRGEVVGDATRAARCRDSGDGMQRHGGLESRLAMHVVFAIAGGQLGSKVERRDEGGQDGMG